MLGLWGKGDANFSEPPWIGLLSWPTMCPFWSVCSLQSQKNTMDNGKTRCDRTCFKHYYNTVNTRSLVHLWCHGKMLILSLSMHPYQIPSAQDSTLDHTNKLVRMLGRFLRLWNYNTLIFFSRLESSRLLGLEKGKSEVCGSVCVPKVRAQTTPSPKPILLDL